MMGSRPLDFEHLVRQHRTPYSLWYKKKCSMFNRISCSTFCGRPVRSSADFVFKVERIMHNTINNISFCWQLSVGIVRYLAERQSAVFSEHEEASWNVGGTL
jgi:hypothetical protein